MELGSFFLFLQEQIKDIIIIITRMTLRLLAVLSAVRCAALLTVMTTVIAPGANPTFHLTMPYLNAASSSHKKTFPAISTDSSWSSASSFVGF